METLLAGLESVLASQHGLVTRQQLRDGDLSSALLRSLVDRRVLRRIRPKVFGLIGAPESWERGLLAAVLSADGSAASHASAARLWSFRNRPEDRYEISVGREFRSPLRGVVIHRSKTLFEEDFTSCAGVRCLSFERTICDCSTVLSERQLGTALDDGLRRGVASVRRLEVCAERLESGPGRHMSAVRALLAQRCAGFDPGGSRSELDVLEVLQRAKVPMPVQQLRVKIGAKTYRPDFSWPEQKIFAEYYGMPFHTGVSAVAADSERLTALSAAGWLPLVFTHLSTDSEIVERTLEALERRRDPRGLDI